MATETSMPKIWDLIYSGLAGSIRGSSCTICTVGVMNAMSEELFLKNLLLALLYILRWQYANFPVAKSAWQKQWGTMGEQEEARDLGFSCDQ